MEMTGNEEDPLPFPSLDFWILYTRFRSRVAVPPTSVHHSTHPQYSPRSGSPPSFSLSLSLQFYQHSINQYLLHRYNTLISKEKRENKANSTANSNTNPPDRRTRNQTSQTNQKRTKHTRAHACARSPVSTSPKPCILRVSFFSVPLPSSFLPRRSSK